LNSRPTILVLSSPYRSSYGLHLLCLLPFNSWLIF
jgi:hypothetical protein